jgi:cytochrome c-type biogenesis protein CcmF
MRNTRRYGGYVVHFGIVLVFIGLSGAAFNRDKQMEMAPGSRIEIGPYTLVCQTFTTRPAQNYTAERATMEVLRGDKQVMMLYPERRFYPTNEQAGTMVSIFSTLQEDLYVVYAGRSPESDQPVIHAYLNPLVKWIWLGGVIVVLGTGLALLPNRQAVLVARAAAQKVSLEPVAQPVRASEGTYERGGERNPAL